MLAGFKHSFETVLLHYRILEFVRQYTKSRFQPVIQRKIVSILTFKKAML